MQLKTELEAFKNYCTISTIELQMGRILHSWSPHHGNAEPDGIELLSQPFLEPLGPSGLGENVSHHCYCQRLCLW